MKILKISFVVVLTASLLASCAKQGPAGPQGDQGPQGNSGVTNISNSEFYLTPSVGWNTITGGYEVGLADTSVSGSPKEGVEAFISTVSGKWVSLPAASIFKTGDNLEFSVQSGQLNLIYQYTSAPDTTFTINVLVIPPAALQNHPNTNWKDYSQVMGVLNAKN